MRAALIPPKGYYQTALQSDYHLVLAQIDDPDYIELYRDITPDDHFVIVDNGAAEGDPVSPEKLFVRAALYAADEIVVPDVIGSAAETLDSVNEFVLTNQEELQGIESMMLVVQGRTLAEATWLIDQYVREYPTATLGIPRHLIDVLGSPHARARLLAYIEEEYGGRRVHLLGTNPKALEEVAGIRRLFPWVRGVDSSLPYNYAIANQTLQSGSVVSRPDHYFEQERNVFGPLLEGNIKTYLGWAHGTEGARG